jgi:hypothetical protein
VIYSKYIESCFLYIVVSSIAWKILKFGDLIFYFYNYLWLRVMKYSF